MKLFVAALFCLVTLSSAFASERNEAWICSWPGASAEQHPVVMRFHVDGENLVEDRFNLPHRILQNTLYAIVAAWSIAEIEPHRTTPSIGASDDLT